MILKDKTTTKKSIGFFYSILFLLSQDFITAVLYLEGLLITSKIYKITFLYKFYSATLHGYSFYDR